MMVGYLLTQLDGVTGSPERPLSDLGLVSYRSYWRDVILDHVRHRKNKDSLSIKGDVIISHVRLCDYLPTELSKQSGINADDLVSTMQRLGILKYCKGQHLVVRDEVCTAYIVVLWLIIQYRNCWRNIQYIVNN